MDAQGTMRLMFDTMHAYDRGDFDHLFQPKLAEGKSKNEALRALKRGISDAVWRQLQIDLKLR